MSGLHDALTDYLATRRALGTQLKWPESSLRKFVDLVETEGAEFVSTELAVRWAVQPAGGQRATHARRLAIVRGFASWLQATDARTQVPPQRLLSATGLRPGEVRTLDVSDVDLVAGVLAVRESKFGKSRFVPLDVSTRGALAAYATFRDAVRPRRESPAFLVTARGHASGSERDSTHVRKALSDRRSAPSGP
jgi:integrase